MAGLDYNLTMDRHSLLSALATVEIGTTLSTFLFGISTLQAYTYYIRYSKDRIWLKLWAISIWCGKSLHGIVISDSLMGRVLELGHAISILHCFYTVSISQYGQLGYLAQKAPLGLILAGFFDAILSHSVAGFFSNRIFLLTGNITAAVFCFSLATLRFIALISLAVFAIIETEQNFLEKWKWLVITGAAAGASSDVLIAGILIRNLQTRKINAADGGPPRQTRKLLDQAIANALKTGLVTSLLSVTVAIIVATFSDSLVWVAVFICQARAHSNSFFGTLNSRTRVQPSSGAKCDTIQFAKTGTTNWGTTQNLAFLESALPAGPVRRRRAQTDPCRRDLEALCKREEATI